MAGGGKASSKPKGGDDLLSASLVNKRILQIGTAATCCVVGMMIAVYSTAAPEDIKHLSKAEKDGARIAFSLMLISTVAVVATFLVPAMKGTSTSGPSAIVITSLLINSCALLTNGLLAFAPVVTMVDPILGTKVYLIRWCEWIPLAGLMTYIADIVSLRKKEKDTPALVTGLTQTLSCVPAILFPFAPNVAVWSLEMFIALVFYLYLFPRLWQKYQIIKNTAWGQTYVSQERLERHNFGLYLFGVCCVVWTILVIMYFVNAYAVNFLPRGHLLRHEATQLLVDATFDVIAKAFYCRLMLDVHYAVFYKERVF